MAKIIFTEYDLAVMLGLEQDFEDLYDPNYPTRVTFDFHGVRIEEYESSRDDDSVYIRAGKRVVEMIGKLVAERFK